MKLKVQVEITLQDDLDRVMSKGLDLRVFYAVKGNVVTVIKNGKTRTRAMSDTIIERLCGNRGNYMKMDLPQAKHMFDSWYDTSTGQRIDSMDMIKDQEKNGRVFCTHEEATAEAKKNRRDIDDKSRREENKRFEERMYPVLRRNGVI